jgi:dihydrofolate reductase
MSNIVYIATSLDGFIADSNNDIEWLATFPNEENTDYGYSEFIKSINCIVIGRKTFETALSFKEWPYQLPVFILSNSMKKLPENLINKAFIVNGNLKTIIKEIKEKGLENIYIDGGKAIQSFLSEDLIDEMYLSKVPIILGKGIPLFGNIEKQSDWKHIHTDVYKNGIIKSHYIRKK